MGVVVVLGVTCLYYFDTVDWVSGRPSVDSDDVLT